MRPLTKTAAVAALAVFGLAAARPSQAAPLPYTYSFLPSTDGYLESLTLSAPSGVSLSDVSLTETVLGGSGISDSTFIGDIAAGKTVASDTDFLFPLSFGDQPENTQFDPESGPLPFVLTVNGTGSDGQAYGLSLTQTYTPEGTPAAVPEPGTTAMLAAGLGLLGVAGLRRKRAM